MATKIDTTQLEIWLEETPSKVLEILKNKRNLSPDLLFIQGEAHRLLGSFQAAITTYAKALKNSLQAEQRMDILLAMAACYRTLGVAAAAYELADDALKMASELEYEPYMLRAMQEMGIALRAWGKLDESLELLDAVLAAYTQQKDYEGMSFICWAKGGVYRLKGMLTEGIAQFKQAIRYAQKCGDEINLAYGYCGLAGISRIAGKTDDCVHFYKKAEKIFNKTEDLFGKAYTQCGMANGLRQQGKYDEALRHYNTADKLYSAIGDKVDLGFVKWGRADILKRRNKLPEALADLRSAQELFANSDEMRGQILTKLSLAQVLYAIGQVEQAEQLYAAGVAQAKKEGLHTYLESYT